MTYKIGGNSDTDNQRYVDITNEIEVVDDNTETLNNLNEEFYGTKTGKSIKEYVSDLTMTDEKLERQVLQYIETHLGEKIDTKLKEYFSNVFEDEVKQTLNNADINIGLDNPNKQWVIRTITDEGVTTKPIMIQKNIDLTKEYKIENNLAKYIRMHGMTQTELAEKLGISSRTLSNIVKNKFSTSLDVALKISVIFGVSVNDIFALKEVKEIEEINK